MLVRANHILPVNQMNTPLAVNSTPMMNMTIALRRSLRLYFCAKSLNSVFIEVVYDTCFEASAFQALCSKSEGLCQL